MPHYRQIQPLMQSSWYTCWAAAMSWWTNAMSDRGRKFMTEQEVMDKYPTDWDQNGAMTLKGLDTMLREPSFMMSRRFGNSKDLDKLVFLLSSDPTSTVGIWPMLVGYNDLKAGGNHVTVICEPALDVYFNRFIAMDPGPGKYLERTRDYLASETMFFAWPNEAGQVL
jgi:hypothetical protein